MVFRNNLESITYTLEKTYYSSKYHIELFFSFALLIYIISGESLIRVNPKTKRN